jgi:hypothetical protein
MGSALDSVVKVGSLGLIDSDFAGEGAQDASKKAANIQAASQQEALDYLKERESMPQAYREAGLEGLGGEYGLTMDEQGNVISDGSTIRDRALDSPYYTGAREQGAEAIMRNAFMTGGLRSGNTQDALYRADADLYQQAYGQQVQGLKGFAGLPSNANNIADATSGVGRTQAQGITAAAQIGQQADQNLINAGLGFAGMLI